MSVDIVHCNRCRALLSLLRDGVDQLVLCANPSVSSQSVTGVEFAESASAAALSCVWLLVI